MKKVITTMLVAAMVLSMAVPTSAATITRKKSTGTTASTTKVSGDYSLKMVDKTLQFIRGGKVVSSIETKDGKITLRKSSAGGISVVFTDANGKRRNITLGKQNSVALSGTFVQVSVDKALGSSFEVEMEKGSKVTNFYAKGAAKVTLNGSVTTLNVTSSNANVAANGTVSRAYAVNKKAISGMSAGKITQTSTGTSASGSVNTSTGSSSSSNTTVNSGSGSGSSSSGGSSGIIINGGGSNGGTTTAPAPVIKTQPASVEIEKGKSATLTIKATATGKISYQWYDAKTQKAIPNATQESVIVTPTETSSYYCIVTNTVGSKSTSRRSDVAVVKVKGAAVVVDAPEITKHPESKNVEVGTEVTLEVAVKPAAGLTTEYQWYKTDGTVNTKIDGADKAAYTFTPTETGNTTYFCQVVNVDAKGNKSLTVDSDYAAVIVTEKVADTDLAKAKTAIEALKDTEYADLDAVKAAITAAATANGVTADVSGLTLDGTNVAGNVVLSKDKVEETVTVPFTATIKAEPTENTDLKAAKEAIEALTGPYVDVDEAKAAIKAAVKNKEITVDDSKVALSEDGKTIAGVVGLSIEVDGKPVTATANFSADVAGQEVEAKAPTFIDNLDKTTEEIQLNTETPVTFTVKASVDGTTENGVTYTWYKSTVQETSDETARKVIGTGNSYTLTTSDLSNDYYYYFVIATNTVDGVSESTPSNVKMIKVVLPEGSAEAPVLSISGDASYTLANPVTDIAVTVTGVTPGTTKLTYEWYKADSINDVGTKVGTNSATYKPSTAKAGVAYYYVKVTNTDSAVTTGLKSVTTTSKRVKITVTATGTVTAKPVTNNEGTETTAIDVTFTPGLPKDTMGALTIADFEIKGDAAGKHDEECTLALSRLTIPTTPADTVRLYVTGADKASETATLTFKKDIKDTGITISDKDREMSVAIVHAIAPAAAAKVVDIEAVPNLSNMDKVLDTKEIKLTFDKELTAYTDVTNTELTMADKTIVTVTPTDLDDTKKVVTATITGVPKGTKAEEVLTLTKLNNVAVAEADQKTVTIKRDVEAPEFVSAILGTDKKTIDVQFSEELKGTVANGFKIKDNATGGNDIDLAVGSGVAFGADKSVVRITLKNDATTDLYVVYDDATGDLTDDSVNENDLASFTRKVSSNVPVDKLAIKNVAVDASSPSAPVVAVEMNDLVKVEGTLGTDLFTVTGKGSGFEYPVTSITESVETPRALASAPTPANAFKIILGQELKAEDKAVGVSVAINTASKDAEKVTSTTNPDANMSNAETGAKDPVEVKVPAEVVSAEIDGADLVITFDKELDGSTADASAFTVTGVDGDPSISSVAVDGKKVTITLASAAKDTDATVKVSYDPTKASTGKLTGVDGDVVGFQDQAVVNKTAAPAEEITVTAQAGSNVGETSVSASAGAGEGTLKYKTSDATITGVKKGENEPAGLTPFTTDQAIEITKKGTYVHVYEIDADGKVVGYGELEITGDKIKCSVDNIGLTTSTLAAGSATAGAQAAQITTGYDAAVTYTLGGTDEAKFEVSGDKINVATGTSQALGAATYKVTVTAEDANGATYTSGELDIIITQ